MGTKARLETEITGDEGAFVNAINRAEKRAATFAGRAQASFTQAFRRTPNMRAERALSGFTQSLASGDIAGGIEAITGRMTGFGLVAGVAIGAGVAVFVKFKEKIDEARHAHEALESEFIKHPVSNAAQLSVQGIQQAIDRRQKLSEELQKKSTAASLGSELAAGLQAPLAFLTQGKFGSFGDSDAEKERVAAVKDLNRATIETNQLMLAQAKTEALIVDIQRQQLTGDSLQGKIAENVLKMRQKIAALKDEGLSTEAFGIREKAIRDEADLETGKDRRAIKSAEARLSTEEKIAKLARIEGTTPLQQKQFKVAEEIKGLDALIKIEENPMAQRALKLERFQKENELRTLSPRETNPNKFAFGTIANRQFEEDQGGFGTLAGRNRDTSDPNVFGSLANSAMNRGESPMAAQQSMSAQLLKEQQTTNELIRQAWLKAD